MSMEMVTVLKESSDLRAMGQAGVKVPFFEVVRAEEGLWDSIVERHIGSEAVLLACSDSSPWRRIYRSGQKVFKIVLESGQSTAEYANSLEQEYELLASVADTGVVPRPIEFIRAHNASILVTELCNGEQIGQHGDVVGLYRASLRAVYAAVKRLNRRGVRHGDLHARNLLFMADGSVRLIDFDQAVRVTPLAATLGDVCGIGPGRGHRSLSGFAARLIASRVSRRSRAAENAIRLLRRRRTAAESIDDADGLRGIWTSAALSDANAPGQGVAYYSLRHGGEIYPGERAWEPRWSAFRSQIQFSGKRVLELGCNLGLLSMYARAAGAAAGGVGIDANPRIVDAARSLGKYTESDVRFELCDLDSKNPWVFQSSPTEFDVVSALSVTNWIRSKQRLLDFLGRFNEILYEGHDPITIEHRRLTSLGFSRISIVSISERGRIVLHGQKAGSESMPGQTVTCRQGARAASQHE